MTRKVDYSPCIGMRKAAIDAIEWVVKEALSRRGIQEKDLAYANHYKFKEEASRKAVVTVVIPMPWKGRPCDFPRGKKIKQYTEFKRAIIETNAVKLIEWLDKHEIG